MKQCIKCIKVKLIVDFTIDKRNKDGHTGVCKECARLIHLQWRNANRKHVNAKSREWAEKNPERYQEIQEKWHTSEEALEQRRQWKKDNPEVVNNINGKRRAIKAGVTVEDVDRSVVWKRDQGICHICQKPADPNNWHLEHIVALVNGGDHSYENVAVSHPTCNLRKSSK